MDWLAQLADAAHLENTQVRRPPRGLHWAARRQLVAILEGKTDISGNGVWIRVGVTAAFPHDLPYVQLNRDDQDLSDDIVAHVSSDGDICYTPTREMVFDPARPVEVLQDALQRALDTLESSWTAPGNDDLLDEFTSYWMTPIKTLTETAIESYFSPDDQLRHLTAWRRSDLREKGRPARSPTVKEKLKPFFAVADEGDHTAPEAFDPRLKDRFKTPGGTALYLPLQASPALLPPNWGTRWTPDDLRRIVRSSLTPGDLVTLDALLETRHGTRDLLILGIPRPGRTGTGRFGLVAAQLTGMRRGHVLKADSELLDVRLAALNVERRDRSLVMQRGSSDVGLSRKRVLLLGCGSLGGHMGFALAAAGVGHLTLVDHDLFSLDNTFRHALGHRFVGKWKVSGMTQALQERFPYLAVEAHPNRTEQVTQSNTVKFETFDLIVDATGVATHHLLLAELLARQHAAGAGRPPLVLAWLETLGLGGHTLTVMPGQQGCPHCLYADPAAPMFNVASFSAPGQELGNQELGCGSYYTPFADLDALKTAEAAVRTAVAILRGQETRSLLRSWRGDPDAFLVAGHDLSKRFHNARRRHLRDGVPYGQSSCPRCGGRGWP